MRLSPALLVPSQGGHLCTPDRDRALCLRSLQSGPGSASGSAPAPLSHQGFAGRNLGHEPLGLTGATEVAGQGVNLPGVKILSPEVV